MRVGLGQNFVNLSEVKDSMEYKIICPYCQGHFTSIENNISGSGNGYITIIELEDAEKNAEKSNKR
jgi:hypothetical protein